MKSYLQQMILLEQVDMASVLTSMEHTLTSGEHNLRREREQVHIFLQKV